MRKKFYVQFNILKSPAFCNLLKRWIFMYYSLLKIVMFAHKISIDTKSEIQNILNPVRVFLICWQCKKVLYKQLKKRFKIEPEVNNIINKIYTKRCIIKYCGYFILIPKKGNLEVKR